MRLFEVLDKIVLQECCQNHCRDWRETIGGYPASNHSPSCPNYKTETFLKISEKGKEYPFLVIEKIEQLNTFYGCKPEDYDIIKIELTMDQYKNMGEFEGF